MDKFMILTIIILLIIIMITIFLYFIYRNKQQAVQIITLESFMNSYDINETESEKKRLIDTIKDFFDDNDGTIVGIDTEDTDDDGGDDGGG